MNKKWSIGRLVGWLVILSNAAYLLSLVLFIMHNYHYNPFLIVDKFSFVWLSDNIRYARDFFGYIFVYIFHPLSPNFFLSYYLEPLFALIFPLINICLGIGIICSKNIFRLIFLAYVTINLLGILLYYYWGYYWRQMFWGSGNGFLYTLPAVFIYIAIFIILTRPNVKEQFK